MNEKKKQQAEEKVIQALDALDESISGLKSAGDRFMEAAKEAALRKDEDRVDLRIEQAAYVYEIADHFTSFKSDVMLGAAISNALSGLSMLPALIQGCGAMLNSLPDLGKLTKEMKKVFDGISKPEGALKKFVEEMDKLFSPHIAAGSSNAVFFNNSGKNKKRSERFELLKKQLEMDLQPEVAGGTVTKPSEDTLGVTGDIDFGDLIDQETKKK